LQEFGTELKPSAMCNLRSTNTHPQTVTQVYRKSKKLHSKYPETNVGLHIVQRSQPTQFRLPSAHTGTQITTTRSSVPFTTHKICTPGHRVWNTLFSNILNCPLHGTDQRGTMPPADDVQMHKTGNIEKFGGRDIANCLQIKCPGA
jgi:hypothetical protein